MNITDKLVKPIIETKYLSVDNAHRYRAIIRFFYLQYEKIKYWMYQEEVHEELSSHPMFRDYTIEQCKQDLDALVGWNNLTPVQDTKKVSSIEDFKNKKFRYQLTEYTVEIERMTIKLENLFIEGASLEPTLLERIKIHLSKMVSIWTEDPEKVYTWWNDLNNDFIRLNQNYQDYIRDLNGIKAEEMMKTREFLLFKDKLIDYLRSFVKSLQVNSGMIEKYIIQVEKEQLKTIFEKVVLHEFSIPRLDTQIQEKDLLEKAEGRFSSIREWFVGKEGESNEVSHLFDSTNEIIRKITRYAAQISALHNNGANRKEEYLKVSKIFAGCSNINEAHRLSALVFGIEKPVHIKGDFVRNTESINSGVYEEEPFCLTINPRIRNYREKTNRSHIRENAEAKERVKQQMILNLEREKQMLESYIKDKRISFAELPVIEPEVRTVLLRWLAKGLETEDKKSKTEDGRIYRIMLEDPQGQCELKCSDGIFYMPKYKILFE